MKSESLHGIMVAYWAGMTRDVGSIPALGTIFPIFITPTTASLEEKASVIPLAQRARGLGPQRNSEHGRGEKIPEVTGKWGN